MKYFIGIKTLEELKKEYKRLVIVYHPDRGGDEEEMKVINAEYDIVFNRVKHVHKNMKGEFYEKETKETPSEFKDLINKLMRLKNIEIEIIGSFVWVGGDTKPVKEQLKELKFRWHSTKKLWYLPPEGYKKYHNKTYSMDEIRSMYGTSGTMHSMSDNEITVA